ncbi:MAG: chromosome segregation protein SMC [bacterium]
MYLSEIRLYGFKSFPDPINLKLNRGITGFVGPNGSGKSNVVDAIRWVLGEQSPKELRASLMEDLIFNGTYKRKPSNLADVSLRFVNEGELELDFSEIEFERKLYRSGDSQYLINRESVRLKDVQKLLIEAGMGVKSYSLFKRSLIEEIVNDKADALRNLFEESAGISHYKQAKKETLRKLIRTQEDLYRIEDLIAEIEKQHRDLKRQAGRAKRYNKYKMIVENLHQYVLRERIEQFAGRINAIEEKIKGKEEKIEDLRDSITVNKKELAEIKTVRKTLEENLNNLQKEKEELVENIHSMTTVIEVSQEKINSLTEKNRLTIENKERQLREQPNRRNRLDQLKEKSKNLDEKIDRIRGRISGSDDNIETLFEKKQSDFNKTKRELNKIKDEILVLKSRCKSIDYKAENIKHRMTEKEEEMKQEENNLGSLKNQMEELLDEKNQIAEKVNLLEDEKSSFEKDIAEIKERKKDLETRMREIRGARSSIMANIEQLKSRIKENQNALKIDDTSEIEFIRNSMEIEDDSEDYVKAAISGFINTILISGDRIRQMVKDSKQLVTFINSENTGKADEHPDALSRFVEAPDGVKAYLSHFIKYDNDDILVKESPYHLVSREGIVKMNDGLIIKGGEIQTLNLRKKIENNEKELEKTNNEISLTEEKLIEIESGINELYREREDIIKSLTGKQSSLDFIETRIKALGDRIEAKKGLIDRFRSIVQSRRDELNELMNRKNDNEDETDKLNALYSTKEAEAIAEEEAFNSVKEEYIIFNNRKNELEKNLSEMQTEREYIRREIEELGESIEHYDKQIEESGSIIEENKARIQDLEKRIEEKQKEQSAVQEELIAMNQRIKALEDDLATKDVKFDELTDAEEEHSAILETLREERSSLLVEHEKYATEKELAQQDYEEDYEIDEELISKYTDNPSEELTYLKEKMIRMEPINQMAFREFEEVSERLDEMNEQKDDIIKAKGNLEKTINTLDAKAKTIFLQYFETIRDNFLQLFMDIFQSGRADIKLADPDNPLESEIQITFEPREKKVDKLVMLSDGERAMMVICLLFAMYMVRPTPVCIMDEIDGPLDDANVENFIKLLKRFRSKTQFILITHNKRTMEFCDYLFGVTMEESGVTSIVSLNLQTISQKFLDNDAAQ